jgi:SpoIID/LytB domain protein
MKKTILSVLAAWIVLGASWALWHYHVIRVAPVPIASQEYATRTSNKVKVAQKIDIKQPIKVWILTDKATSQIKIRVQKSVSVLTDQDSANGKDLAKLNPWTELTLHAEGGQVVAENVEQNLHFKTSTLTFWPFEEGSHQLTTSENESRSYYGKITFKPNGSALQILNELELDDYVASVVAGEMPFEELEAVKAQAIAARTYALRFANYLNDTTDSQVYYGKDAETAISRRAAEETVGKVVTYNGELIIAYFSASNGGHTTTNVGSVGEVGLPYIKSFADPYDTTNPLSSWSVAISRAQVHQHLSASFGFRVDTLAWASYKADGRLRYVGVQSINKTVVPSAPAKPIVTEVEEEVAPTDVVVATDSTGKPIVSKAPVRKKRKVVVQPAAPSAPTVVRSVATHTVSNAQMRIAINALKGGALKNNNFRIGVSGGSYIFSGRGAGHGAGMSQYGAREMARQGKSADEILTYYYKDTQISDLSQVNLSVAANSMENPTGDIENSATAVPTETASAPTPTETPATPSEPDARSMTIVDITPKTPLARMAH